MTSISCHNNQTLHHVNPILCFMSAVAVPVDIRLSESSLQQESQLVVSINAYLQSATLEEVRQVIGLAESRELELLSAGEGSVRLFWWCRTRRSLDCLLVWLDTGRLLTASQQLVNLVSPHHQLAVSYLRLKQYLTKYAEYFSRYSGL